MALFVFLYINSECDEKDLVPGGHDIINASIEYTGDQLGFASESSTSLQSGVCYVGLVHWLCTCVALGINSATVAVSIPKCAIEMEHGVMTYPFVLLFPVAVRCSLCIMFILDTTFMSLLY